MARVPATADEPIGLGRLGETLQQPDTVLFVGAGVAAWSGLPTWSALIAELADFLDASGRGSQLVRRELACGDLLQAASFGFDVLTPQERATFVRAATRAADAQPSALHRRLATLGPACFITTNYDKLLERALASERPDTAFKVVTNLQLVETASIIQSRARDFVFKPHGDVDAGDSIVLTREQYRTLHGERRHAFDAFKTLLASRPMLFVGFGLRDPDFLLVKDTLATVYQGAAQDHYALVADVDEQEIAYWRNNYGIHLVSYATRPDAAEPQARHAELLDLLDLLAAPTRERRGRRDRAPADERATMALLRHARRMVQTGPPPDVELLPLVGYTTFGLKGAPQASNATARLFVQEHAVAALRANRERLLLTGAPGAGKSFTVRAAVAALAEQVIDAALADEAGAEEPRVPAYVDLRDYVGDLWEMVVESFPVEFPLDRLVADGRIAFFVDGLNEVPARIVEDNSLHDDLTAFLQRIGDCSAVLVTRFGEEHAALELPEVALEAIPEEHLRSELEAHGLTPVEISEELLTLLARPVFYRFCVEHRLWDVRTPHAIYVAMLDRLGGRFRERFGQPLDLAALFGRAAYDAIDVGDQSIAVDALVAEVDDAGADGVEPGALVNWLLAEEMLVPRLGGRVSFFHHSVVEHLAAHELVVRYRADSRVLKACLRGRRWDHVVLLAIGFLEPAEQAAFFDDVLRTDAVLGLRALAYLDHDWQRWTREALLHLAQAGRPDSFDVAEVVASLRIEEQHEPLLLALGATGGTVGGAALAKTLDFGGRARVGRALDALFAHAGDYDCCAMLGYRLRSAIDARDRDDLLERVAAHPLDAKVVAALADGQEGTPVEGLVNALGSMLGAFPLQQLRERIGPLAEAPPLVRAGLLNMLQGRGPAEWLGATAELLPGAPGQGAVTLYFQLSFRASDPGVAALVPDEVGPLLLEVEAAHGDGWSLAVLELLAGYSDAWRSWVAAQAAAASPGVAGAMLWQAAGEPERFFETFRRLLECDTDWSAERLGGMHMLDNVDWSGREDLLMALLRERDDALATAVLGTLPRWRVFDLVRPAVCPLGDLAWWIEWLAEPHADDALRGMLGYFVMTAARDDLEQLLRLFGDCGEPERAVLVHRVLAYSDDLRLEQLPAALVDWAVEDLRADHELAHMESSLLARVATEELVERRLLPLLADADEPLRSNLADVLRVAGDRHRRRYMTDVAEPIA